MDQFYQQAVAALTRAGSEAAGAADAESALLCITRTTKDLLGDKEAHLRPEALKGDERQFSISGAFLLSTSGEENLLVAEVGFPEEQHRLRIPVDLGHPGWVAREKTPLLLANTDEHAQFKQILKTSRMGSAMFAPMIWKGRFLGQIVTASQARNTYGERDLEVMIAFASMATACFVAHGGEAFREALSQER